jgi:SAM-dependent methyltransferase
VTEPSFLSATRTSYDTLAENYAATVELDLSVKPIDRALYAVFAELVQARGNGPVADVGCGPGWMTAELRRLGLDAFGIDLSPASIALARRTYPGLRFEVGSMLDLELADGGLGGLLAAYSIIHVPWELRPKVLAEFHRVLAPGGQLLLLFQIGDEVRHRTEAFGQPVDLVSYRQRPAEVAALLGEAGFDVRATVERRAEGTEKAPQGYVLADKPG